VVVFVCIWIGPGCRAFRGAKDEFVISVRQGGVRCPRYNHPTVTIQVTGDIVNDDYCDCEDGADEPGTPACGISKFFCRNDGPEGRFLNSSWVNDGFCDCCDGSDEYDGQIQCENRCSENMEAQIRAYKDEIMMIKRGLGEKAKLENLGESSLQDVQSEIQQVDSELSEVRMALERVKRIKELTEKLKEEAEQNSSNKPTQTPDQSIHEDDFFDDEDIDYDEDMDYSYERPAKTNSEPSISTPGHAPEVTISSDDPIDKPSTDPIDKPSTDPKINSQRKLTPDEIERECQQLFESLTENSVGSIAMKALSKLKLLPVVTRMLSATVDGIGSDLIAECSKKARDKFSKLETDKFRLERKAKELQEKRTNTASEHAAFRGLAKDCIKSSIHQYVYELCVFDTVRQYEQGKVIGSLGKWKHWSEGKQLYDRGVTCWQGPQRSTTVDFKCGDRNIILDVQEPERCVYRMSVATPAVCDHSAIGKLEQMVARLMSTRGSA